MMSLLFAQFCDLLHDLEEVSRHDPPYLSDERQRRYKDSIQAWFATHRISLSCTSIESAILLSSLFPAKRTDRVYGIQAPRLFKQIGRYLQLSTARLQQLKQYLLPGRGDLGDCVERVLSQAENPEQPRSKQVKLQEIDDALVAVASQNRFSGKEITRSFADTEGFRSLTLDSIYKRLRSREAKWLTRLILKDLHAVDLDPYACMIYSNIDTRLPMAMRMFDSFELATAHLKSLPVSSGTIIGKDGRIQHGVQDARLLSPQIGIKVGPPGWVKAKGGIDHASMLIGRKTMSIERKHDGEYCQIHLDLSRGEDCIQIFSKSGKDSTEDRKGVLSSLKKGLRIGHTNQGFSSKCILEGELLVWSDRDNAVLDFHKIRKHVPRSGVYIGTKEDSQPHPYEHLMMVLHDVLLIDGDAVLHRPQRDRRWLLEQLLTPITGRVALVERQEADFSKPAGTKGLKSYLAEALAQRWEGLVLKPANEPYFGTMNRYGRSRSQLIKLKKDCIQGFGDSADFAVVGAGYDGHRAQELGLPGIKWTHFFLGCLKNRHAVQHTNAKAEYLIVDCVTSCLRREDFVTLNQRGVFVAVDKGNDDAAYAMDWEFVYMDPQLPQMQTLFREPFVFDIAGSGFYKAPNRSIFTLRFPRVLKVRCDSDWRKCIDAPQLQAMAEEARTLPEGDLQDEIAAWKYNLDSTCKLAEDIRTSTENSYEDGRSQATAGNASKASRRRNENSAPTLVRTDTAEMPREEERAEVYVRPSSGEFRDPLPTIPPPSSPLEEMTSAVFGAVHGTVKRRERPSDTQIDEGPTGKKRARGISSSHHNCSGLQSHIIGPLRESSNAANRSQQAGTAMLKRCEDIRPGYTGLVRKIKAGAEGPYGHKRRRTRLPMDSSPGRETTSDEFSSAVSSPVRTMDARASRPIPAWRKSPAKAPGYPTPRSDEALGRLVLPDVRNCVAFLNTARKVAPKLYRFYCDKRAALKPFLRNFQDPRAHAASNPSKEVICLVEPRDAQATTEDLLAIAATMPALRKTVMIWDWRLLEILVGTKARGDLSEKPLKDLFIAQIVFAGGELGQAVDIRVNFRDGTTKELSRENIKGLKDTRIGIVSPIMEAEGSRKINR